MPVVAAFRMPLSITRMPQISILDSELNILSSENQNAIYGHFRVSKQKGVILNMGDDIKYGHIPGKRIVVKQSGDTKLSLTREEFEALLLEINPYPDFKEYERLGKMYNISWATVKNLVDLYRALGGDLDKMDFATEESRERSYEHGKTAHREKAKRVRRLPKLKG